MTGLSPASPTALWATVQVTRHRSGTGRPSVEEDGRVRRPRPNQRNKSDGKENTRQPQLCSVPGPACDEMTELFRLAHTSSFHGERISRESMALPFPALGPTKCWATGSQLRGIPSRPPRPTLVRRAGIVPPRALGSWPPGADSPLRLLPLRRWSENLHWQQLRPAGVVPAAGDDRPAIPPPSRPRRRRHAPSQHDPSPRSRGQGGRDATAMSMLCSKSYRSSFHGLNS